MLMALLNHYPAAVVRVPDDLAGSEKLIGRLAGWGVGTLILADEGGLNPFIFVEMCRKAGYRPDPGLCIHTRDRNAAAVLGDLRTAEAMDFKYLYFREPDHSACREVNAEPSYRLVAMANERFPGRFTTLVQNSFRHARDVELLKKHLAAGASFVLAENAGVNSIHYSEYSDKTIFFVYANPPAFRRAAVAGGQADDVAAAVAANGGKTRTVIDFAFGGVDDELARKLFE